MTRFCEPPARVLPGGLRVYTARTPRSRTLGLAWLPSMDPAAALHFPRCRSVHTFGMRFALDLVWLDAAGAVLRVDRDVPPRRLRSCRRARSVVEVAAGRAAAFVAAGL
ncbi:DUF192 domain-containing protein [Capillimicrobium parvum]|uniref:DUF192 domain-containing protein n=1 Tax=Capillimicrobium parvum TaxID=2884022 RepID=A0A9E7C313_9ACTN|nr:DUF192 domain-containing protein [Capillimicrobium parvum]UGS38279.1 hypothetical protein DSM104329_04703 [Capillimicrobium parvum]